MNKNQKEKSTGNMAAGQATVIGAVPSNTCRLGESKAKREARHLAAVQSGCAPATVDDAPTAETLGAVRRQDFDKTKTQPGLRGSSRKAAMNVAKRRNDDAQTATARRALPGNFRGLAGRRKKAENARQSTNSASTSVPNPMSQPNSVTPNPAPHPTPNPRTPVWVPDAMPQPNPAPHPTPSPGTPALTTGAEVVADLVVEGEEPKGLPMAEEWDSKKAGEEKEERRQKNNKRTVMGLLVLGALLTAVILVIVFVVTIVVPRDDSPDPSTATRTTNTTSGEEDHPYWTLLPLYTRDQIRNDPDSPPAQAYDWMCQDPRNPLPEPPTDTHDYYSADRWIQRFALAVVYYATNGPAWTHQGGGTVTTSVGDISQDIVIESERWLDYNSHECDWYTTRVDENNVSGPGSEGKPLVCSYGNVTAHNNAPVDTGNLMHLQLKNNGLGGFLPPEIALLTALQTIDLHSNEVGRPLPTELGIMPALELIKCNSNRFTGTLPTELRLLSNTLKSMGLQRNAFEGTLPWGTFPHVDALLLGRTRLLGTLPTNLPALVPNLARILAPGQFNGTLPSTMGLLQDLSSVSLGGKHVEGTIPTEIGLLWKLDYLSLQDAVQLVGTIPSELGNSNQRDLQEVNLVNTPGLYGSLPQGLCNISELYFDCFPWSAAPKNATTLDDSALGSGLCGCDCPCILHNNNTPATP